MTPDEASAFMWSIGKGEANGGTLSQDRIASSAEAALDRLLADLGVIGDRAAVIGLSMGAGYGHDIAAARPDVAAFVGFIPGSSRHPGASATWAISRSTNQGAGARSQDRGRWIGAHQLGRCSTCR